MNIKEAKREIERAVKIYLTKDKYGRYKIPVRQQRPVYLQGPPGIGKTAVVEQIAEDMDIALVAYSMTHHTRQSALGLPYIVHKEYDGRTYDISEYTMSEIIASIYETMAQSGKKEGILFLDEINCVSETLAPSMLQFLQYKTFGRHKVPEGWVICTAGNPAQFNRSVREFDVVTLDRMKVLEVTADFEAWRDYAVSFGLHGAVLSYLDIRKSDFYVMENSERGRLYVTARGWEDLSKAMYLYEENDFPIDETLVAQYLHHDRIAREFTGYYELYSKYKKEYGIEEILAGKAPKGTKVRAGNAGFDERLSLLGLLFSAVSGRIHEQMTDEARLKALHHLLRDVKADFHKVTMQEGRMAGDELFANTHRILSTQQQLLEEAAMREEQANDMQEQTHDHHAFLIERLADYDKKIRRTESRDLDEAFFVIRRDFEAAVAKVSKSAREISAMLENLFDFCEDVFGSGNEMLILLTDLTASYDCAAFINEHGCKPYFKFSKKYRMAEQEQEIEEELERLQL